MGIVNFIKKLTENRSEMKERFEELQKQDKLQTMLEERKKSANRRELERYQKELEEEQIKQTLEQIRKQKNEEMWTGNQILNGGFSILRNDKPIIKRKSKQKWKQEALFFKW